MPPITGLSIACLTIAGLLLLSPLRAWWRVIGGADQVTAGGQFLGDGDSLFKESFFVVRKVSIHRLNVVAFCLPSAGNRPLATPYLPDSVRSVRWPHASPLEEHSSSAPYVLSPGNPR